MASRPAAAAGSTTGGGVHLLGSAAGYRPRLCPGRELVYREALRIRSTAARCPGIGELLVEDNRPCQPTAPWQKTRRAGPCGATRRAGNSSDPPSSGRVRSTGTAQSFPFPIVRALFRL